ncbi:MAG: nickel pincer cofactor biosynthesis protein LarC, partial [Lentisphaerae bacterium]|nr:nickel pincer cofactor biosynthesis protein LarC [Lentisphaerota bacterium]
MRSIRFDSVGGASGDMILATLIDLGADPSMLSNQLASLHVDKFSINAERYISDSFSGTRVTVNVPHKHDYFERHLSDIVALIDNSNLSQRVKTSSKAVFELLAAAEAKAHNTTPDRIHFHEVGAMDSIVDIVASCSALELLNVDVIHVGPLPLGCGTITCAHGVLPIPVPATAEILAGSPVVQTDEPFELVTPTGAALLTAWRRQYADDENDRPTTIVRTGAGFGHHKLKSRPNMLRGILMESCPNNTLFDYCTVLECNIDDTVPELLGTLAAKLLKNGALDTFTTAVQMKKQRPGILFTVLCMPQDKNKFIDMI